MFLAKSNLNYVKAHWHKSTQYFFQGCRKWRPNHNILWDRTISGGGVMFLLCNIFMVWAVFSVAKKMSIFTPECVSPKIVSYVSHGNQQKQAIMVLKNPNPGTI